MPFGPLNIITAHNSSCGKVMFSQACVKNSVHERGGGVSRHTFGQSHTLPKADSYLGRHPLAALFTKPPEELFPALPGTIPEKP